MDSNLITAVGIDVSKGKSTVAIRRPGGEIVRKPFTVKHDQPGLQQLIQLLHEVGGEIRIVMEHTGMYWRPIASVLQQEGFYLSVVNAILTHQFNDNSLRKVKTDKADSLKLANYALAYWSELKRYDQEDETRQQLKFQSRLYQRTIQTSTTLRNGLISILDQTFPNANQFFSSSMPTKDGHHKWIDFVERFWHKDCVATVSLHSFAITLEKWCKRNGYRYSYADAEYIHAQARNAVATLPKNDSTKLLIMQAVHTLNTIYESLQVIRTEMQRLASLLPEYPVVMEMKGAGQVTGPQLMAEIGDGRRWLPLPEWMLHPFSPATLKPSPVMSPSAGRRPCVERCFRFAACLCAALIRKILSSVSWTKSDPKESISMFIRLPVLRSFCAFIMLA